MDAVRELLERGAPVNAQTGEGHTALHAAADGGHAEVVQMLLAAKADPNVRNAAGDRPIDLARRRGEAGVVKVLEPVSR
jgi:hypothetical protein